MSTLVCMRIVRARACVHTPVVILQPCVQRSWIRSIATNAYVTLTECLTTNKYANNVCLRDGESPWNAQCRVRNRHTYHGGGRHQASHGTDGFDMDGVVPPSWVTLFVQRKRHGHNGTWRQHLRAIQHNIKMSVHVYDWTDTRQFRLTHFRADC